MPTVSHSPHLLLLHIHVPLWTSTPLLLQGTSLVSITAVLSSTVQRGQV